MAQFDVHRNIGRHKDAIPFVVVVQSSQFDGYRRRVVVPLVEIGGRQLSHASFNPTFKIRGTSVVLHPLEIVLFPLEQLGDVVGSLSEEGRQIIAALDELLSRAWK